MTEEQKMNLHMQTILAHRKFVSEMCDLMGISEIGEQHDLSKFSEEELSIAHWADGTGSPHDKARAELGYSPSWVYHKAANQHHWEFWLYF